MQRRIQPDLQKAVAAGLSVGLALLTHGKHKGMHHGVGGIVAQKAQHILHLRACADAFAHAVQKLACFFLVHTVAETDQVIAALGALFPHFKAEKAVRPIGTGGKGSRVPYFAADRRSRQPCRAHMGIAFGHGIVTSYIYSIALLL